MGYTAYNKIFSMSRLHQLSIIVRIHEIFGAKRWRKNSEGTQGIKF